MKKLYIEPELELLSIRLLADVLGPSQYVEEETVPDATQGYTEPDGWVEI